MKLFNNMVTHFGFVDKQDFMHSFIHLKLLQITIPVAAISAFFEQYFGLKALTIFAFVLLLTIELLSGFWASKIKHGTLAIASNPLKRFGFKLLAWLIMIFILNSFKLQWEDTNLVIYTAFDWLYSLMIIYISFEYLISVIENIEVISGKSDKTLVQALRKKLRFLLGLGEATKTNNYE